MKCSVCGKTETQIKQIIDDILVKLQEEVDVNTASIISISMDKLIAEYSLQNGFTVENKDLLQSINDALKTMTLNAFIENKDSFIQMEPKLNLLHKYATDKVNGFNPQSDQHNQTGTFSRQTLPSYTLGILIESFCKEPDEIKIGRLKAEFDKNVSILETKNKEIQTAITHLKNTDRYLFEVSISFKHFEIPGTQKVLPPPPPRHSWDSSWNYGRQEKPPVDIEGTIQRYAPAEYKRATTIILCPYCKAMFANSSYGALTYKYAEEQVIMDEDDYD